MRCCLSTASTQLVWTPNLTLVQVSDVFSALSSSMSFISDANSSLLSMLVLLAVISTRQMFREGPRFKSTPCSETSLKICHHVTHYFCIAFSRTIQYSSSPNHKNLTCTHHCSWVHRLPAMSCKFFNHLPADQKTLNNDTGRSLTRTMRGWLLQLRLNILLTNLLTKLSGRTCILPNLPTMGTVGAFRKAHLQRLWHRYLLRQT